MDQVVTELADHVAHIRYDIGLDWTGDRSMFSRIVLKDKASRGKRLARPVSRASDLLREKRRATPLDRCEKRRGSERVPFPEDLLE